MNKNNIPPTSSNSVPNFPVKNNEKKTNASKKVLKNIGNAVLEKLTNGNIKKSSLDNHFLNNHKIEEGNNYPRKKSSLVNNSFFFSTKDNQETNENLTDRILDLNVHYSEEDDEKISENKSSDNEEVNDDKKKVIFEGTEDLDNLKFSQILDTEEVQEKSQLPWIVGRSLFLGAVVYLITSSLKLGATDAKTPKVASESTILKDVFGSGVWPTFMGILGCFLYLILSLFMFSGKRPDVSDN